MERKRVIGFIKYAVICLAFVFVNKADDIFVCESGHAAYEILSEIRKHESDLIKTENSKFSAPENQCRVPRQSNFTTSLRTAAQAHRNSQTNHSRNGFTLTKSGKSMNGYTTSLFIISILNFPSGMNETSHHLIGLRKLII